MLNLSIKKALISKERGIQFNLFYIKPKLIFEVYIYLSTNSQKKVQIINKMQQSKISLLLDALNQQKTQNTQQNTSNADIQYVLDQFSNESLQLSQPQQSRIRANQYEKAFIASLKQNRPTCANFLDIASRFMVKIKKTNFNEIQIPQDFMQKIIDQLIDPQLLKDALQSLVKNIQNTQQGQHIPSASYVKTLIQAKEVLKVQKLDKQKFKNCLKSLSLHELPKFDFEKWLQNQESQ